MIVFICVLFRQNFTCQTYPDLEAWLENDAMHQSFAHTIALALNQLTI
jgi:hypothetical protein